MQGRALAQVQQQPGQACARRGPGRSAQQQPEPALPELRHAGGHPAVGRVFAQAHKLRRGRVPRADPAFGQKAEGFLAPEAQAELTFAARTVKSQGQDARRGFLKFFQARAGEQREQQVAEAAEKMGVHARETTGERAGRQQRRVPFPPRH